MLLIIAQALWFFLPAAIANAAPIAAAVLPGLKRFDTPLDLGKRLKGKPILGPHKTWRGIAAGMIIATLVLWAQVLLVKHISWLAPLDQNINYAQLPVLLLGPALGLGALLGDAAKSFFKRRLGFASGDTWIPFDQLDYVIGGVLASLPFVRLPLEVYLAIFVLWFVLHLAACWIGWKLGLKARPI